jgi:hypothetical protein
VKEKRQWNSEISPWSSQYCLICWIKMGKFLYSLIGIVWWVFDALDHLWWAIQSAQSASSHHVPSKT